MNYAEMMHEVCVDVIEIVKVKKKNPDFNFLIRKGQLAILSGAVTAPQLVALQIHRQYPKSGLV